MIRALVLAFLVACGPAFAAEACRGEGSAGAKTVALDPDHPSGLFASIPVVVKLHGLTSAALAAMPMTCERGRFAAGRRSYVLTGEDGDPNAPRRATSPDKSAPMAVLAEVFDLGPALAAPPQPGAEPRGVQNSYALATALNDVMVVWKIYDAIPDDARLKADMAAALTGSATPVMRFDMRGGSVQILGK